MNSTESLIPFQLTGNKSDNKFAIAVDSYSEAYKIFTESVQRLLDVNKWDNLCGGGSAVFSLTDEKGLDIDELIQQGRFIKIDVPGPGPKSGDGFDWVYIEKTESLKISDTKECFAITVRPSNNPQTNDVSIAHFFKNDATSTFMVCVDGNIVIASVHGRNEIPNTETEKHLDNIRNEVVAASAIGFSSDVQWKKLAKGIINGSKE